MRQQRELMVALRLGLTLHVERVRDERARCDGRNVFSGRNRRGFVRRGVLYKFMESVGVYNSGC